MRECEGGRHTASVPLECILRQAKTEREGGGGERGRFKDIKKNIKGIVHLENENVRLHKDEWQR